MKIYSVQAKLFHADGQIWSSKYSLFANLGILHINERSYGSPVPIRLVDMQKNFSYSVNQILCYDGAIREVQAKQNGLKLNGTRQFLFYADEVNL